MSGFAFRETMSGSYHRLDRPAEDHAIEFTISANVDSLRRFVRDRVARIEGEVTMEGFATRRALSGTLGLKLLDEHRLPYEFSFRADDGRTYSFRGEKDVLLQTLPDSITTLPGSVFDEQAAEIARAVLRFDLRGDLFKFIKSFRLKRPTLRGLFAKGS